MKASELIKLLEEQIKQRGDVEVFIEAPGMNCEDVFSVKNYLGDYVAVDDLSKYPKKFIYENWGEDNGTETGLIWSAILIGDEHIEHNG